MRETGGLEEKSNAGVGGNKNWTKESNMTKPLD